MPSLEQRLAVFSPRLHDAVPLTVAAKAAGVSTPTAQRWLAGHRPEGASALVRCGRADNGEWRIPAELVELIEWLTCRLRRCIARFAKLFVRLAAGDHGPPAG